MGQRSQIYVKYNGKLIIANYYQWNYGERMISRARYGIEYLKYYVDNGYTFQFESEREIEKFRRYFDVNFDMKDIVMSVDIFKEYEDFKKYYPNFEEYAYFKQGNNDGKLLIDIRDENIKYAFVDCTFDMENIMTAEKYIDWNTEGKAEEHLSKEDMETLEENIKAINEAAELMTREEVERFVTN